MDTYKKIFSKQVRFAILKILRFIPDRAMIRLQYWIKLHRCLNLKNPQRYTEKIQWMKLNYNNPQLAICVDKYRVREFLHSRNLDSIAVKLYAVGESVSDIDWDTLPNRFILKTTNGSGTNIICRDKSNINLDDIKKRVRQFLKQSSASAGREWPYTKVTPRIIIEELLYDPSCNDGIPNDYKILCFNGVPEYIVYDTDRYTLHRRNIYNVEWTNLNIDSDCPQCIQEIRPPKNLKKMLEIASQLSFGFPAVRVDLYNINGKIYFGEMTFFPWSGYVQFSPDIFDYQLGSKLDISQIHTGRR